MAKKKYDDDDGRTIANMNVEGMPWYQSQKQKKNRQDLQRIKLTRKERRAIIKGTYIALLPMLLCVVASFSLVMFLIWLVLR